ncbi:hypothetical protein GPALN_004522 [Globodera pallida]|nr:hypothetical protein GPALN_004522 [Globodera pallida]
MIARCGNKAGHLSLMRNFVRELLPFKLEEQKEAAQQRGEGIGLKTPMDWPISDNGGWADATKLFGCDKPYNLAPRPAQREICGLAPKAATVATNVRPKQQETGNKTPSTELLPSKERKVQTIKAPDEWFQTYARCLAQSLGSRKLFPLKRQKKLRCKSFSSFSRCKLTKQVMPKSAGSKNKFHAVVQPVVEQLTELRNSFAPLLAFIEVPIRFRGGGEGSPPDDIVYGIAPMRPRGGGEGSNDDNDSPKQQHQFLLERYNANLNDQESSFAALRLKFGPAAVARQTYENWWKNFIKGQYTFRQRGRPCSSASSSVSSVCTTPTSSRVPTPSILKRARDTRERSADRIDSANMEVDEGGQIPLEEALEAIVPQELEPDADVTAQNDFIGSTHQGLNNDLGVETTQSSNQTPRKDKGTGRFVKGFKCVQCKKAICPLDGFRRRMVGQR